MEICAIISLAYTIEKRSNRGGKIYNAESHYLPSGFYITDVKPACFVLDFLIAKVVKTFGF